MKYNVNNAFLAGSKYCDVDSIEIRNRTKQLLSSRHHDEALSAIRIFDWVRDEVKYSFDFWNVKASDTIRKMSGMCANKANLQISMLRSAGIPAGYTVLRIRKEALRTIANDEIYERSSDLIIHVYCCVFLNGEWVGADATVDRELYEAAYLDVPDWDYLIWDGQNHIHISDNYILDATGPYHNIDRYMDMPPRFLNRDIIDGANSYIEQLRAKVRPRVGNL